MTKKHSIAPSTLMAHVQVCELLPLSDAAARTWLRRVGPLAPLLPGHVKSAIVNIGHCWLGDFQFEPWEPIERLDASYWDRVESLKTFFEGTAIGLASVGEEKTVVPVTFSSIRIIIAAIVVQGSYSGMEIIDLETMNSVPVGDRLSVSLRMVMNNEIREMYSPGNFDEAVIFV